MDRHRRDKSSEQRIISMESELEPVHGSKYCRRRTSNAKRSLRMKTLSESIFDSNRDDENAIFPKSKSRRHLRKEIEGLIEENHKLSQKLENYKSNIDNIEEPNEKVLSLSKIQDKYQRLQREHESVVQVCVKTKTLLDQREVEYKQLHIYYEEALRILEEERKMKNDLLTKNCKYEAENIQLNEDLTLLKNVVFRLNEELERYQNKLRECGKTVGVKKVTSTSLDNADINEANARMLESWGSVNIHALGPLLDAYQENLMEKEELIAKYECEIGDFGNRCKEIVMENECMQKEIEDLKLKCNRYMEEIKVITEDATLVKEQNDILMKQTNHNKQKLQEIHSLYEHKIESTSQDHSKLSKEYIACKTELSNLSGKYEILREGYEKLKNETEKTVPLCVHTAAVQECKNLLDELKLQYETEKKKLSERIKHLEESHPDQEKQLMAAVAERNQLRSLTKTLEKNLKKTQNKLESVQNTVYSMQASRDSFRKQLYKTTSYCKELVLEYEVLLAEKEKLISVLHEKEKEDVQIRYLGDSIAHRMGNLKSQLKNIEKGAKEQLATVERQIKTQETGVNQMKSEYQQELQRLKHLLRQKENIIGQLQKEKYSTRDNLELIWRTATTDKKKVKSVLKGTKVHNV